MPKSYIVFICSSVCPSVRPCFCPSVQMWFYNQVLPRSFLLTYNSAGTDQKLFIFGMGVPGRVLSHSTCMNPWVLPQGRARGQNLEHPNKEVFCSLFIQTTLLYPWHTKYAEGYIVFVHSVSPFICHLSVHLSRCISVTIRLISQVTYILWPSKFASCLEDYLLQESCTWDDRSVSLRFWHCKLYLALYHWN